VIDWEGEVDSIAKIKVLLGKTGLDSQNKKIRALARGLREVGDMEVIYTGLYRSLEEIVDESISNSVDVIGISVYNGLHMTVFPELKQRLAQRAGEKIIVSRKGSFPLRIKRCW
jgi:methylmalonyl-CoA mutase C-terminal domain/subunit